ncbi:MAG: hypothetical protein ACI97A_000251 [Planctomycetota bacterium]|jgi:hypothetical protein
MTRGAELDIEKLLKDFDAPVTAFDCGQLCAPANGGVPVCCESSGVIPVLYKSEFNLLQKRSDLWQAFKPSCKEEKELVDDHGDYQLAVCTKSCFSERDNRSLNCRSFPFLPYFDHDSDIVGLVYDYEAAEGKCPLVNLPQTVTKEYIAQAVSFWQAVSAFDTDEMEFYRAESKGLRKRQRRMGEPVMVLVEAGVLSYPTRRSEWSAISESGEELPLTPYDRP